MGRNKGKENGRRYINYFQATFCTVAGRHHQPPHASLVPRHCSAAVATAVVVVVAEVAAAADGADDGGGGGGDAAPAAQPAPCPALLPLRPQLGDPGHRRLHTDTRDS